MNRKKAIEVLEALSDCNYIGSLSGEDIEALTMAIRCLKVDEMYGLEYEDPEWADKLLKENERLKKELQMLMLDRDCEKHSGKWIPVSERLPDTEDKVLCWYEYYHWSQEKILPEYGLGQYICGGWFGEVSNGLNVRVIAWQPLPAPYKEEQTDEL